MPDAVIDYLQNVLGVQTIVDGQATKNAKPVKVLFMTAKVLGPKAHELLLKMAAAMRLKPEEIDLCEGEQPTDHDLARAQQVVIFRDGEDLGLVSGAHANVTVTVSPEVLLIQPQLKKMVWETLQIVMKRLT